MMRGVLDAATTLAAAAPSGSSANGEVESWAWIALAVLFFGLLATDLWAHRKPHVIGIGEAGRWVGAYVAVGVLFGFVVLATLGLGGTQESPGAIEYWTGYAIELSLSMDNVFVFAVIFTAFAIPREYRHRVLLLGVLGAIVFRAIFILVGAAALERFAWVALVFGAILLFTGFRLFREDPDEEEESGLSRFFKKRLPITDETKGQHFFTKRNGKRMVTPLFACLIVIELTDILFAVDSVPAILSITTNTFIVFAANAFAILGLRQLFFLLDGLRDRFRYLHYGLALLLVVVGLKLIIEYEPVGKVIGIEHIPPFVMLPAVLIILGTSIAVSLRKTQGATGGQGGPPTAGA